MYNISYSTTTHRNSSINIHTCIHHKVYIKAEEGGKERKGRNTNLTLSLSLSLSLKQTNQ
jgi:hypothetical protein